MPKAIVLLSGGLDSSTVLAIAKSEGFDVFTLTFHYGQRHSSELVYANRIAKQFMVAEHKTIQLDLRAFGGSALTADIAVPKRNSLIELGNDIPITYVPGRNLIFLSFAVAYAESLGAADVFIGVNALDYSGYPDCRPEFIDSFQKTANLATRLGVSGTHIRIRAPLIALSKREVIEVGTRLGVDYSQTTSCYDPGFSGEPCGRCDACLLRAKGFAEAGIADPLLATKSR